MRYPLSRYAVAFVAPALLSCGQRPEVHVQIDPGSFSDDEIQDVIDAVRRWPSETCTDIDMTFDLRVVPGHDLDADFAGLWNNRWLIKKGPLPSDIGGTTWGDQRPNRVVIYVNDSVEDLPTFRNIILHEVGHAYGLAHSADEGDVMFPFLRGSQELSRNDVDQFCGTYVCGCPYGSIK